MTPIEIVSIIQSLEKDLPLKNLTIDGINYWPIARIYLGFELDDTRVKRAGLDYWKHISLTIYESIEDFYSKNNDKKMVYFSSHGKQDYWSLDYLDDLFLIFGKESKGLPKDIIEQNIDKTYKIPLFSEHVRSINLANAVSVVVYEAIRNIR